MRDKSSRTQDKISRTQDKLLRTQDDDDSAPRLQGAIAPELEPFALSIPHAITRLFREQNRLHGRAVKRFELSTEQAHLLLVLWTYGPMTMTELGKEVALSSGTLSTAIDRMEEAELVTRVTDPDDRRIVRVEPASSAEGWTKARRTQLTDALLETEEVLLKPLSVQERTTLHQLLERVLDGLDKRASLNMGLRPSTQVGHPASRVRSEPALPSGAGPRARSSSRRAK